MLVQKRHVMRELYLRAQFHIPCGTLHFGARVGVRRARDVGERGHMRLADRNALSAFAAAHHTKGGNWRTVKLRARLVERSLAIAGVEGTELPHILRRRAHLGEESESICCLPYMCDTNLMPATHNKWYSVCSLLQVLQALPSRSLHELPG